MFVDANVSPAFYEAINSDPARTELRHEHSGIRRNGLASLAHVRNQMASAGLDLLLLHADAGGTVPDSADRSNVAIVDNDEVAALVEQDPEHFAGVAAVDPLAADAAARLERAFTDLDLLGLRLHLGHWRLDPLDDRLVRLYEVCEAFDRPVVFDAGMTWEPNAGTRYTEPMVFEPLAIARPSLRFCLTQLGWPWVTQTAALMLKYPQVHADTAALYFDSAREFYAEILTRAIPATWIDRSLRHQLMFGSANPRFEQIRMAHALGELPLREETKDLIRGTNAVEFFRLPGHEQAGEGRERR
ncbi:amidohydrolase family protein [Actinoallomurus rhizosphaericola]|uniref:amidohydrolase family protein n=1 Tax=Actinoallomurus rhizosphaericola TaxID=2952536 RepID=UPI002093C434|nr:amidohydrolase family protein [Actinoallomurus rhizosphaericola]MCO5997899.1 amidohydrolase family protein [Actinoallomurus rhizosphaericola]